MNCMSLESQVRLLSEGNLRSYTFLGEGEDKDQMLFCAKFNSLLGALSVASVRYHEAVERLASVAGKGQATSFEDARCC